MNLSERIILKSSDGTAEYFVASICYERRKVALVRIDNWFPKDSQFRKPEIKQFSAIKSLLDSGNLIMGGVVQLPPMMLKTDKWLENAGNHKWLHKRDKDYHCIKFIVENDELLKRYIFHEGISDEILEATSKNGHGSVGKIYRLLNRYIAYGSIKNALLPIQYRNSGNRIEFENLEDNVTKRGRKTRKDRNGNIVACRSKTRGITAKDKTNILRTLKKHGITNLTSFSKFSFEKLFADFQSEYQSHIIIRSTANGDDLYNWLFDEEDRISKKQFYYHARKLVSDEELLKLKVGKVTFEKDKAVKTGLARDGIIGPGYCYAIDATTLDIYVKYPYNPKIKSCGRPVLYLVVDVWSTCIVGFYLGFHGPDWVGAGEALLHACSNKAQWAKTIGWDLNDDEWPCHFVPRIIFGDNGTEYSEYNIRSMLSAEIGVKMMSYAPIFRGDAKSVVERKFGVLNNSFIHFQPGYVPKQSLRELPHSANNATWDYRNLVIAIGKEIIFHNNNTSRLKLHNFTLARSNTGITPQALFSDGIKREMGGGTVIEDRARLRFAFLREEEATVHGHCVTHRGLEYKLPQSIAYNMHAKAKYGRSFKIPVRITNTTASYIWHRDDEGIIHELTLRDDDHWAHHQRREIVMAKMEEYAEEERRLNQKSMQERIQLNLEHEIMLARNKSKLLKEPKNKGMPDGMKEAKAVMAEKNHHDIVQLTREDFAKAKSRDLENTTETDIDDALYSNYGL